MKTVNIQVRWAAAHPGQDRRLPGVVTHSKALSGFRLDQGWRSSSKTALGSLSTGSPAGHSLPLKKRRDGSMYSQAYVKAGRACWLRIRSVAVIVDTEQVSAGSGCGPSEGCCRHEATATAQIRVER